MRPLFLPTPCPQDVRADIVVLTRLIPDAHGGCGRWAASPVPLRRAARREAVPAALKHPPWMPSARPPVNLAHSHRHLLQRAAGADQRLPPRAHPARALPRPRGVRPAVRLVPCCVRVLAALRRAGTLAAGLASMLRCTWVGMRLRGCGAAAGVVCGRVRPGALVGSPSTTPRIAPLGGAVPSAGCAAGAGWGCPSPHGSTCDRGGMSRGAARLRFVFCWTRRSVNDGCSHAVILHALLARSAPHGAAAAASQGLLVGQHGPPHVSRLLAFMSRALPGHQAPGRSEARLNSAGRLCSPVLRGHRRASRGAERPAGRAGCLQPGLPERATLVGVAGCGPSSRWVVVRTWLCRP